MKPQSTGGVSLRVAVHQEDARTQRAKCSAEIDGGGRLADSALLIDNCNDHVWIAVSGESRLKTLSKYCAADVTALTFGDGLRTPRSSEAGGPE